jgi:hypothetical protein
MQIKRDRRILEIIAAKDAKRLLIVSMIKTAFNGAKNAALLFANSV